MEFLANPTIFKADTKTLHFRIDSMLHVQGDKQYNNLKLSCFKTNQSNQRVDLAEFYINYAKFRALLTRINYMSNRQSYRGKTFTFNYVAEVPSSDKRRTMRNLTVYFEPAKKLSFVFSDGKQKGTKIATGEMTGNLGFHLSLAYDIKDKSVTVPDQLQKFDELMLLTETINVLELINGKDIFKPVETTKGE